MGDEVRYSQLLNDLSLSIPTNVWIKNLSYTSSAAPTAGTAATAAPNPIRENVRSPAADPRSSRSKPTA